MLKIMLLRATLFPEPVAPATNRCGMPRRSATTCTPKMSFPNANFNGDRDFAKESLNAISFMATSSRRGFGTSMPTTDLPGMGATMRMLMALKASARSSARFTMRATFTPGAGSNSYIVTTGPTCVWMTWPLMPKLARALTRTLA